MNVLHVGSKNYPPAHGGVEKVVYDITHDNSEFDFFILTEWENAKELDNVKTLPKGFFRRISFLFNFVKRNSIDVISFHKESFSIYAIIFSIIGYNTILVFHGLAWRISRWGYLYRSILYTMDLFSCFFVDKIVFVSESDKNHYKKIFFWRNFYLIPNGVICNENDSNNITLKRVCYLGRISPEKNILNLIKAANADRVKLDLYGPFDKRDTEFNVSAKKLIESSNFVNWKGQVESNMVYDVFEKYNVFINPSFSEGMPVSVLEAAANKCYLVLSDIEGHRRLDFPDVTYVECQNINLNDLKLGRNSHDNYRHVLNNFSLDKMKGNYNKLYRNEQ